VAEVAIRPSAEPKAGGLGRSRRSGLRPGQHAVITGGSSGLGLLVAHRLVARGLAVTLVARNADRLEEAADELRGIAPGDAAVRAISVDVSREADVREAFAELAAAGRDPDVLVNSAGILREGRFEDFDPDVFRSVVDINLFGVVNTVRAALPGLRRRRGRIVNVASIAGLSGVYGYTAYCASKHGLVGFTEALRYELKPQGVRVHLVCPGEFDSPMVEDLDRGRTAENRAHAHMIPKLAAGEIADELVRGVERDRDRIVPGRRARITVLAQRMAPGVGRRLAEARIASAARGT
jgi:3-dehydrosphinganine reductase